MGWFAQRCARANCADVTPAQPCFRPRLSDGWPGQGEGVHRVSLNERGAAAHQKFGGGSRALHGACWMTAGCAEACRGVRSNLVTSCCSGRPAAERSVDRQRGERGDRTWPAHSRGRGRVPRRLPRFLGGPMAFMGTPPHARLHPRAASLSACA